MSAQADPGLFLIFGVTFISFVLMVYFGPDMTEQFLGKNPTPADIAAVRAKLHLDDSFMTRYLVYLKEIVTLDFGASFSTGESVNRILIKTMPISLAVIIPGFVLGNLLGLLLALIAAYFRGGWIDKLIMAASVVGMSISFLIVVIVAQIMFCSDYGLNWFPSRGWSMGSVGDYLSYVTVPTIATVFVALGYNTRFYRAVIVEELSRDHVRTARAFGAAAVQSHGQARAQECADSDHHAHHVLDSAGGDQRQPDHRELFRHSRRRQGHLRRDHDSDQPILKAVVGLTAVLFVVTLLVTDILYRVVDPRVDVK